MHNSDDIATGGSAPDQYLSKFIGLISFEFKQLASASVLFQFLNGGIIPD